MRATAQRTLLRELMWRLTVPLLLIVAATGALGLYTAQRVTDLTFDRWLIDSARSLAQQVRFSKGMARLELGGDAEAILAFDDDDRTYFSVRQGDRHVGGHVNLPTHGENVRVVDEGRLFDAQMAGQTVRVAQVDAAAGSAQAQVYLAETLRKRQTVRADLRLMLIPLAVLLVVAAAAVMLAVRWTLKPLQPIAQRWKDSSQTTLQAVSLQDVPRELQPFARTLNEMLSRVHDVLDREKRFVANAAHQIRTPLTGLQLGLSRASEAKDLQTMRSVIEELRATTRRTSRLLQQILTLGRLDPEQARDVPLQDADLVALAAEVGESYLETALSRRIEFELITPDQDNPGGPSRVMAQVHADLMREALGNLVDNALRYTPECGRVLLRFEAAPPTVIVEDSGPGIAPQDRESMLERFVRGPQSGVEGSGLGLAIARDIATLHGARLELHSSALGGLLARIVLP